MWFSLFTLDRATNVYPAANSLFPMSTITEGKVWPWLLRIVLAYLSWSGICCLDNRLPLVVHSKQVGDMGTQLRLSVRKGGGALYVSKSTRTAIGKSGGLILVL